MRKITLLTTMALSAVVLGTSTLTANAAIPGKAIIIGSNINQNENCDVQSILENLKDCLDITFPPNQNIPNLPGLPDTEQPDVEQPDTDKPGADKPGTDKPDTDKPGTDKPGNDKPDTDKPGSDDEQLSEAEQVVKLVNEERAKHGLSALKIDTNVTAAAQVRAMEIQTSFSHTRPDGTSFSTALKEQNVNYRGAGENIAWGQKSPEQVMEGWMNSEGHRANILNEKFTTIGVGYAQNVGGTKYWTQLFTY